MTRQPLSNNEMHETLGELLDSKDFKDDHSRAQFLAGMKIGLITARPLEPDELLRMCGVIFLNQQVYDPQGETWDKKTGADDTT